MSLSREDILKIAGLAHLELAEREIETFRSQLSSVLDYVGQLADADVSGLEPVSHVTGVSGGLRADDVVSGSEASRRALISAAPDAEGDLVKVKAVFR